MGVIRVQKLSGEDKGVVYDLDTSRPVFCSPCTARARYPQRHVLDVCPSQRDQKKIMFQLKEFKWQKHRLDLSNFGFVPHAAPSSRLASTASELKSTASRHAEAPIRRKPQTAPIRKNLINRVRLLRRLAWTNLLLV
jgi:hypothetical protein